MSIRTATTFWMAAGALSGEARNQMEMPNDLAEYFSDAERDNEVIAVEIVGVGQLPRPLTYRGTDYGQWTEIWRLGLPTQNMGAPSYVDRIIQFVRTPGGGGGNVYALTGFEGGSAAHLQLRAQSLSATGATGVTAGPNGREWGYF